MKAARDKLKVSKKRKGRLLSESEESDTEETEKPEEDMDDGSNNADEGEKNLTLKKLKNPRKIWTMVPTMQMRVRRIMTAKKMRLSNLRKRSKSCLTRRGSCEETSMTLKLNSRMRRTGARMFLTMKMRRVWTGSRWR